VLLVLDILMLVVVFMVSLLVVCTDDVVVVVAAVSDARYYVKHLPINSRMKQYFIFRNINCTYIYIDNF